MLGWKDQNKTTTKIKNTTWRDKGKDIGKDQDRMTYMDSGLKISSPSRQVL